MAADWLARVDALTIWRRAEERAPHKPLLLLYAIGQLPAGRTKLAWPTTRGDLSRLLLEFGPRRKPRPVAPGFAGGLAGTSAGAPRAGEQMALPEHARPTAGHLGWHRRVVFRR